MKKCLEQDVITALEFWDVDGLTMKKFHYDKKEVDFDEVFSDIVKNRSQMGYYIVIREGNYGGRSREDTVQGQGNNGQR